MSTVLESVCVSLNVSPSHVPVFQPPPPRTTHERADESNTNTTAKEDMHVEPALCECTQRLVEGLKACEKATLRYREAMRKATSSLTHLRTRGLSLRLSYAPPLPPIARIEANEASRETPKEPTERKILPAGRQRSARAQSGPERKQELPSNS